MAASGLTPHNAPYAESNEGSDAQSRSSLLSTNEAKSDSLNINENT